MNTDFLDSLNDNQRIAASTTEGPLLVVAGPGTGKTLTIVSRIAYLIQQGIKPEHIVAVTFTNRAAREMRDRTETLLGKGINDLFVGTFHALGMKILKELSPDSFVVYSREDQLDLVGAISRDSGIRPQDAAERISRIKSFVEEPDPVTHEIYEEYQSALRRSYALDFDDLILKPIELFGNGALIERYRNRFRHIIVDEYQDISPAQYRLLRLLAGNDGNICAVGDSDQAIYAFRGADIRNFLSFEEDYRGQKTVTLSDNYRSTGLILSASSVMVRHNRERMDKVLKQTRETGFVIPVVSVPDEKSEGEIIVREIEKRMGGTSHYQMMHAGNEGDFHGCAFGFSDFAVICRTNAQVKIIEESFVATGIPCQVVGGAHLLKKKEIADTLLFLKALINPHDDRTLRRAAGTKALRMSARALSEISGYAEERGLSLFEAMKATSSAGPSFRKFIALMERLMDIKSILSVPEFLRVVADETGIRDCYELGDDNFLMLESLAAAYRECDPGEGLVRFMNELSLLTPADAYDQRADAVALMTIHMAKGLEFRVVFISGVEDGIVPFRWGKDEIDIEEERRLFYVGMTRAMDELFLLHARSRFLYGQRLLQSPSPFLGEIPGEFTESIFVPDRTVRKQENKQMGLF